ncbi:MAG TPA: quinate 5-dehydrogenase [Clostridiales bacterium UBA8153]|nr:quinate 5-dehydrogenase [Clostridiales bacterium UBA8153]
MKQRYTRTLGVAKVKHVVSVSLGSSHRDKRVEMELLGQKIVVERRGVDGDMGRAEALLRELDGKVDAFGLGGIDFAVSSSRRKYHLRDAGRLLKAAGTTPMVDGSGVKASLERKVVADLEPVYGIPVRGRRALVCSAAARHPMAEALVEAGAETVFGDLMFILGLPFPIRSLNTLDLIVDLVAPLVAKAPIGWLVPVGEAQHKEPKPRFAREYARADLIAGDYHMIHRYLPSHLPGKTIVTNTVTSEDVELLRQLEVRYLVTTSPEVDGRSFATNVLEAALVALSGKRPAELAPQDYLELFDRAGLRPRVQKLT